jgi:diguanylate cyclase (GGDEF)-like protein/PAS domain S-box-containing protein
MVAHADRSEIEQFNYLLRLHIIDSNPEQEYDDLTHLAATVCGTPVAVVSIIDNDRMWFKSCYGLNIKETPTDISFCKYAIYQDDIFEVPNALEDSRFANNPFVTGEPHVRFYAGMPLISPEGQTLGTLCVVDQVPKKLTNEQKNSLRVLAKRIIAQIMLRLKSENLDEKLKQQETIHHVMDNLVDGLILLEPDSKTVIDANIVACEMFGYSVSEFVGLTIYDLASHDRASVDANGERITQSNRVQLGRRKYRRKDGGLFDVDVGVSQIEHNGKRVNSLIIRDVSEQVRSEAALKASEAKFRNTVDKLSEGLYIVDLATDRFLDVNSSMLDMLGYSSDEFFAKTPFEIIAGETQIEIARNTSVMQSALVRDGRYDLGRKFLAHKNGSKIPVSLRVSLIPNDGAGLHAVVVQNLTEQIAYEERLFNYQIELERANERLKALAVTDGLTQVFNRAAFNEKLTDAYERAVKRSLPLSVILLDVDHFKLFNDTFGHPAGDDVLKTVAKTLMDTVRSSDMVARYGGEEFAIILPDTDHSGAMVLAERCRRAVAAVHWDKRAITLSIGVSAITESTMNQFVLVEQADEALYCSKQTGRNRVSCSSKPSPKMAMAQ